MTQPLAQHILTYALTLDGGGVERVQLRLAREWVARGRRVTLIVGCDAGPLADEIADGVECIRIDTRNYAMLVAKVPGLVARLRPDTIFCPGNRYTAVAGWTRARLGRACPPTLGKLSNALDRIDMIAPMRAAYALWLRMHPAFLDRLVAMSPAMATDAAWRMAMPERRLAVIENPPPRRGAGAVGVDLPPRYLLGVGRLVPQKRWDRAIAALARLADSTIPLVLLGEGPDRAKLVRCAETLGIADRLILAGHVPDPMPAMAGAAAVVLTSDYEGVPGVVREALSVGAPVVTTDSTPAVYELIPDTRHGTIVGRDDADALVAAIDQRIGAGGERPTPVAVTGDPAGDYLSLFDSLVASRPSSSPS
ncbi:glycosyltransferase [uncultured Sphingomonas sp.]|uniref:glycosyltransferase n=1 Tax=uncultured Sphingomonas sp. TaxID=158754 RepID=UPI0025F6BE38|nr:glycosyltransferase [uncultured Sphingomonas sp.]